MTANIEFVFEKVAFSYKSKFQKKNKRCSSGEVSTFNLFSGVIESSAFGCVHASGLYYYQFEFTVQIFIANDNDSQFMFLKYTK